MLVRQHHPESVVDELGHLFTDEVPMLARGGVASSSDTLVFLLESPRFGGGLSRDTLISPLREEGSGRVVEVF